MDKLVCDICGAFLDFSFDEDGWNCECPSCGMGQGGDFELLRQSPSWLLIADRRSLA